jgi:hypothetical protein
MMQMANLVARLPAPPAPSPYTVVASKLMLTQKAPADSNYAREERDDARNRSEQRVRS